MARKNVHITFKREKADVKLHKQYEATYPKENSVISGYLCKKRDFRKHVCPGANRSLDSVGEFHVMFTFFVFFWTFTRVMNCFYIKNKALSPEIKTSVSLSLLLGGSPL